MKALVRVVVFFAVISGGVWAWLKTQPARVDEPVRAGGQAEVGGVASPTGDPSSGVWTSRDGRTMKGRYVSATETAVTVRREDGQVFTIPLVNLSGADAAWVLRQKRGPAVTQQQLDEIVARFPYMPALTGEITNDLRQLHDKYRGMVKFMRPGTIEPNLKMIRSKIADDVKTLSQIAGTRSGDWTGKRGSSQSAAAESGILSARSGIAWLEGALSEHLRAYEGLLGSVE